MAQLPTEASLRQKMAEARRVGRQAFLDKYAGGRGSDNWYVEDDGVHYDLKAIWAAAHRPPVRTTSWKTYAVAAELRTRGFTCVSGVETPQGLPGDAGYSASPAQADDDWIRPVYAPVQVPPEKHFKPTGYWLFLANPARWKAEEWWRSGERELLYLVSKDDRQLMQPGDLGLIRLNKQGGEPARFLAVVEVMQAPEVLPETNPHFFTDRSEAAPALRTKLAVISSPEAAPVSAAALPTGPEFQYLHEGKRRTTIPIERSAFLAVAKSMGVEGRTLTALRESRSPAGVRRLERSLAGATPIQKERVSKVIERGPVGNAVKAARQGRCQVCEALKQAPVAFTKKDGAPYSEAHHVIPVSEMQQGTLGCQNILVLCPNHHRQAHYGAFVVDEDEPDYWTLVVDGERLQIEKTKLPT